MTTLAEVTLPVDNSNAKQLDVTPLPLPSSLTEADLFMPRAIFQNKNKSHHHSMTTQADVTLPVDNSNAKQLDVTPPPLPSSLTEADLFMPRAIFQNIKQMPPSLDDNTSRRYPASRQFKRQAA